MSISGPLWSSFPLPLSILLSGAQTEPAWSVLLPLSGLGSDKTMLSTWSGQCCAENLVYGPSTEYASIPIAHDSRDGAGLQQPLCWYQESCRRGGYSHSWSLLSFRYWWRESWCWLFSPAVLLKDKPYFICTFMYWWCADYGKKSRNWDLV